MNNKNVNIVRAWKVMFNKLAMVANKIIPLVDLLLPDLNLYKLTFKE